MPKLKFMQYESEHTGFGNGYDYVQLPHHINKKGKGKILFVLDYMPGEDLKTGKLFSGATGELFQTLTDVAHQRFEAKYKLADYDWLAITYNACKTSGLSDTNKETARWEFKQRLLEVISEYKPDTVVTFGNPPAFAINEDFYNKFRVRGRVAHHHFYGVPVRTKSKYDGNTHRFNHVAMFSLNPVVTATGKGEPAYLIGYLCRNMVNALEGKLKYKIPKLDFKVTLVDDMKKFKRMMKILWKSKVVSIDTETTNLNRVVNKMLTIQFAVNTEEAFVLPYSHKDSPWIAKEFDFITKKLVEYFETCKYTKQMVFANAVFDLNRIRGSLGVRHFQADVWDVFAGEFGLDENMKILSMFTGGLSYYTLANLSVQYGCTAYYDSDFGKDKRTTIAEQDINDEGLLNYCSLDVILPLYIRKLQRLRAKQQRYDKYAILVAKQISDMIHTFSCLEMCGSKIDTDWLFHLKSKQSPLIKHRKAIIKRLSETKGVEKTNKRLLKESGGSALGLFGKSTAQAFDISKQKHRDMLFFDVMKLKPMELGKKGTGKSDKVFQKEYGHHEEVALFTELQKVNKIFSSYVKAFVKQWGSDSDMRTDGAIRPFYWFLDVVTGRTSAKKPSLHQIPSRNDVSKYIEENFPDRGDLGKYIKRMFIAEDGRIIIKVDYAAHEVRGWSLISGDKDVAEQFNHGYRLREQYKLFPTPELAQKIDYEGDVHKLNASYFFGIPIEKVEKPKRNSVKQVIFGLIYQQGLEGVANSTGQTLEDITDLVDRFFKRFPVGAGWFDKVKKFSHKNLFVESPLGRRRNLWAYLIPKSAEKYKQVYSATERRAVNSPVQGMGSDYLVSGSREIEKLRWKQFEETGHYPDMKMRNSVHDSLEFSVAYRDLWNAIRIIEEGLTTGVMEEMTKRHGNKYIVPLEIDFEIGANNADCPAWGYDLEGMEDLLRNALKFQKKELGYDVNIEKTVKMMMSQYDDMPSWAKQQAINTGRIKGKKITDYVKFCKKVGRTVY